MQPSIHPEDKLSDVLESNIESVMRNWDLPDSDERVRFEKARLEFQPRAEMIANEAAAIERLDAKDFAFRINATR
jgi:hypothetical protein